MAEQMCHFCGRQQATPPYRILCSDCFPQDCPICEHRLSHKDSSESKKPRIRCTTGHELSIEDLLTYMHDERIEEFSRTEQIMFAGPRVEAIIPNPKSITAVSRTPSNLEPTTQELVLYHSAREEDVPDILEDGRLKSLSELGNEDELNDMYEESLRYDAVFGWPFTCDAGPGDFEFSKPVYFTVPFNECVISSYTYLEEFQADRITLQEYDQSFCFDVEEFLTVCCVEGMPYKPDELLYFNVFPDRVETFKENNPIVKGNPQ